MNTTILLAEYGYYMYNVSYHLPFLEQLDEDNDNDDDDEGIVD